MSDPAFSSSFPGLLSSITSLPFTLELSGLISLGTAGEGDNGVLGSVYSGSGSTAFPCLLVCCLGVVEVVMDAAY